MCYYPLWLAAAISLMTSTKLFCNTEINNYSAQFLLAYASHPLVEHSLSCWSFRRDSLLPCSFLLILHNGNAKSLKDKEGGTFPPCNLRNGYISSWAPRGNPQMSPCPYSLVSKYISTPASSIILPHLYTPVMPVVPPNTVLSVLSLRASAPSARGDHFSPLPG